MTARDITSSVARFREAARHLWNCHYLPIPPDQNPWDLRDSFDTVARTLFGSLVLEPLGMADRGLAPASAAEPVPIGGIIVVPSAECGVPIMINRDDPRSGYWDHPRQRLGSREAELLLARFFDFDEIGPRDFRYLEVMIASAPDSPEIVGRWALLDFEHARIFAAAGMAG